MWVAIRIALVEAGISVTSKLYWIARHGSGSKKTPPGARKTGHRADNAP